MALIRPLRLLPLRPILCLPPAIRQSIFQHQNQYQYQHPHQHSFQHGTRHFSLESFTSKTVSVCSNMTPNLSDLLSLCPAELMHQLHNLGLPYCAILPLSALLIRTLIVYPYFQKPYRKRQIQRLAIQPLIDAKLSETRFKHKYILRDSAKLGYWHILAQRLVEGNHSARAVFDQIWPLWTFKIPGFLTLLVMTETVRKVSGYRGGLLSLLLGPIDGLTTSSDKHQVLPAISAGTPPTDFLAASSDFLAASSDLLAASSSSSAATPPTDLLAASSSSSAATNLPTNSPWFEPAMLTEGLSWCPDLTVADPTCTLPFLFSASFFASIYFAPRIQTGPKPGEATNLQRIFMTIAVLSIYPALQMPVALLLYLIPNIWIGALQSRWLLFTMPVVRMPQACSRPVRSTPRRELKDEFADDLKLSAVTKSA